MPTALQASMSSVPAGAVSCWPSTVKVTSGIPSSNLVRRADEFIGGDEGLLGAMALQILFKLAAELLHEAERGHGCCVAERAEGAAHHVFGEVLDVVNVLD